MKRMTYLAGATAMVVVGICVLRMERPMEAKRDAVAAEREQRRPEKEGLGMKAAEAAQRGDREGFLELFGRMVKRDPREAAELLEKAGAFRQEALRVLMQEWAASDEAAAHAWALERADGEERLRALNYLYFQIAESGPGKALRMAQADGVGDGQGTLRNLAQQWAGRDFPEAKEWVAGLPAGPERDEICGRMAMARAATQPDEAARWVVAAIPEGPAQDEAVMSVLNRWLDQDITAAAAWIGELPDSDLKARALREIEGRK